LWLLVLVSIVVLLIVVLQFIGMLWICKELYQFVLEEEGLSLTFDIEEDLGSVGIHDSSNGVEE